MYLLQALQIKDGSWYTIKTFDSAGAAWLYIGKVSKRYRVIKAS